MRNRRNPGEHRRRVRFSLPKLRRQAQCSTHSGFQPTPPRGDHHSRLPLAKVPLSGGVAEGRSGYSLLGRVPEGWGGSDTLGGDSRGALLIGA